MKRCLLSAVLLTTLIGSAFSDQTTISSFKYLDSNDNSVVLNPSEASDLLNVDISPSGRSVKKRPGYGFYKTAFATSTGLHGGFHSFDISGNNVQLWASSVTVVGIVNGGTPNIIVSSMTVNSTLDCADSQGFSYCVDSSRDFYIKTDGTNLTQWFTTPIGTMVESTPDRIVVAGVSSSPNTLYVSQSNTFTNFTTGVNPTDAFTEVIAAPGSHLTHIRWGCAKLLWWKDQSFGYFDFDDQFSAQVKTVSDNIGTFDNASAIDPGGNVWFRGQDSHTYKYDCSALERETVDITPQILLSGRRTSNVWTQSSATDFGAGTSVYTDTTTSPGNVLLPTVSATPSTIASSAWTPAQGVATYISTSSLVILSSAAGPTFGYSEHWVPINVDLNNQQITMSFVGKLPNLFGFAKLMLAVTDSTSTFNNGYAAELDNVAPPLAVGVCPTNCSPTSASFNNDYSLGANDRAFHTVTMVISATGIAKLSVDGSLVSTKSVTKPASGTKFLVLTCGMTSSQSDPCEIQSLSLSVSTGSYYTAVHNANSLVAWNTFSATDNTASSGGTISYFTRSSTNSFSMLSATPTWTTQPNGSLVASSPGTYFQARVDFSIVAATETPTLNDLTLNWFEGSATDQAYLLYFDNAIWESVTYGSGVSRNNYIFRNDLINNGWGLYAFGAGGMLIEGSKLYFGDTSNGNIYQFGSGASDNGTAITAYWKSKDFTATDPFTQVALSNIDIFAKSNQNSTLTSTYTTDTSTSTTYSFSLTNSNAVVQSRKLLPSGKQGYTFNIKVGDISSASQWEVLGIRAGFLANPYRPTVP